MESRLDSVMQQLARELSDAIAAAVAADPRIEACRAKAKAEGYELRVSLEAAIGFASIGEPGVPVRRAVERPAVEMTATDRRFLKSLRIAADEPAEKEVE